MRLVVQRVQSASVEINGSDVAAIDFGLLAFVGISKRDAELSEVELQKTIEWTANKLLKLKLFEDQFGKMSQSVETVQGSIVLVSQFTLYADVRKGTSPSWSKAAAPDDARKIYHQFVEYCCEHAQAPVQEGQFQAHMNVSLVNDGPVTVIIDAPEVSR